MNDRPMRVCAAVPAFCHPDWRGGGMVRTATDLMMALAQLGHEVTVVSPTLDADRTFPLPAQTTFVDGRLRLLYSTSAVGTRFGTSATGLSELLDPLLTQADVVHVHSFFSPWTSRAATLARRRGVPYVIQDHGKLTPSILRNRSLAKRVYLALVGQRILREAAFVVPSAPNVADALTRWDRRLRVAVCTNGLDPREFDGPAPPRPIVEPYLLYLGYLDARKNLDLLVNAFSRIRNDAGWKLALVGPDSYGIGGRLRAQIERLGLQDRVVMPGMVEGVAKMAWLKNADLFVLPSSGEGLSLAMLEALACGVPNLLSPGCNYPEIETAAAGEVVPLTEDAWTLAIQRWTADQPMRQRAGQAARRLFESAHALPVVARSLESILRRAAEMRNRAA